MSKLITTITLSLLLFAGNASATNAVTLSMVCDSKEQIDRALKELGESVQVKAEATTIEGIDVTLRLAFDKRRNNWTLLVDIPNGQRCAALFGNQSFEPEYKYEY